jgi:hypothetical protein
MREVKPGDSLWAIAGSLVAPDDVPECTDELYRRNRHVIGSDPDLLFPGQKLLLPEEGC